MYLQNGSALNATVPGLSQPFPPSGQRVEDSPFAIKCSQQCSNTLLHCLRALSNIEPQATQSYILAKLRSRVMFPSLEEVNQAS